MRAVTSDKWHVFLPRKNNLVAFFWFCEYISVGQRADGSYDVNFCSVTFRAFFREFSECRVCFDRRAAHTHTSTYRDTSFSLLLDYLYKPGHLPGGISNMCRVPSSTKMFGTPALVITTWAAFSDMLCMHWIKIIQ